MKKKILAFLLVFALLVSTCIFQGSAKKVDSLADIAALSKLEPIGTEADLNAYTELAPLKSNSLPESYSSKDLGYTTDVRQQNANICWAFSSLASLETLLLKSGENVEHFSPEHMNIWGSMEDSGLGWQRDDLVNDGGYSYIPMGYLTSWNGPLKESDFPIGTDKSHFETANELYSPGYGVTGIKYVTRETPIETVKSYVMENGAVVANFNADTVQYMNSSSDGFYCGDSGISTANLYGHAVSIVGWDDNYPKENFSTSFSGDTPQNNGAWLIKNSWGKYINTSGGYFWISYEDQWLFHSIFGPSFTISDFEKLDGSLNIYQNETYGATAQFTYLTDESFVPADKITYMNVFDFEDGEDDLDSVVFESTSFGADYTAYYIPVFGDKPTQETFLWQELGKGTVDYTGYISVDTDGFDLPAGKGAIGITIDNTRTYEENKGLAGYEYISNSIGVCEWLAFSGGYYFKNQGNAGESFVLYSEFGTNHLYDLMDFYMEYFDDSMGATFVIKAITKSDEVIPPTTVTEPTTSETPAETTTTPVYNTISLGITLEFVGDNRLTVIGNATGGTGEYEYEFSVDGNVIQAYSAQTFATITLTQDGEHNIKISCKDTGGRVIAAQTSVTVEDGKLVVAGAAKPTNPTEPTETTTAPTSAPPQNAKAYIMGDADLNGKLSIKDATGIQKHLAKIIALDEISITLSDVDGNDKCTIKDATCVQKHLAKIDSNSTTGETVMLYIS